MGNVIDNFEYILSKLSIILFLDRYSLLNLIIYLGSNLKKIKNIGLGKFSIKL